MMQEIYLADFIKALSSIAENSALMSENKLFELLSQLLNPDMSLLLKIDKDEKTLIVENCYSTSALTNIEKIKQLHITSLAATSMFTSRTIRQWKHLSDIFPSVQVFHDLDNEIGTHHVFAYAFFYNDESIAYAFVFAYRDPISISDHIISTLYVVSKLLFDRNRQLKKVELSDVHYRQFFMQNPIFPIALLENRRIVLCNRAFLQLLGYNDEAFVMKKSLSELSPLVQPDNNFSLSAENKLFQQLQSTPSLIFRWSFKAVNQQPLFTYCFIQKINDPENDRHLLFVQNITHLQKIRKQFNYLKNQLTTIYNIIPAGVGILQNRCIVEVNEYFLKLTGYSRQEILNKNVLFLYANPEDYEHIGNEIYPRSIREGYAHTTVQLKRKDGQVIWCFVTIAPLFPEMPERGFVATALDITELKKTEQQLKQALQKIEEIYNTVPVGIIEVQNRVITEVNKSLCQMLGYEREELIGFKTRKLYVSNRDYLNAGNFIYGSLSHQPFCSYQTSFKKKTGEKVDVLLHVQPSKIAAGEQHYIATVQDITQLKIIEQQLKSIESQHKNILANAQDVICQLDMHMRIVYSSPSIHMLTGYQPDEIIGQSLEHLFTPEEWNRLRLFFNQSLSPRRNVFNSRNIIETSIKTKYGTTKYVELVSTFISGEHPEPAGILVIARDITERKQHQLYQQKIDLLQSEIARFVIEANTMNSITDLIQRSTQTIAQLFHHSFVVSYLFHSASNVLQYLCSSYHAPQQTENIIQPPQNIVVNQTLLKKLKTKQIIVLNPLESRLSSLKLNEISTHQQTIFALVHSISGNPRAVTFIIPHHSFNEADRQLLELLHAQLSQTITKRLTEIQLAQNEKMLRSFLDSSNEYAYVKNTQHRYVYINNKFLESFPAHDLIGKTDRAIFPVKVATMIRKNEQNALMAKSNSQTIIRHRDKIFLLRNFPITFENEQTFIGGVLIDVSEDNYKKAEREFLFQLQQSKFVFPKFRENFHLLFQFLKEYYFVQCMCYWHYEPSDQTLRLRYSSSRKKSLSSSESDIIINKHQWHKYIPHSTHHIQIYSIAHMSKQQLEFLYKLLNQNENLLTNNSDTQQICILHFHVQQNLIGSLILSFSHFLEDTDKKLVNVLNQVKVIIEKKLSELFIREQEQLKSLIVSQISEALLIVTSDLSILFANDAARRIFGEKYFQNKIPNLQEFLPEPARNHILHTLNQVFSSGSTCNLEIELTDATHKPRYFQVSLSAIVYDSKPACLMTFFDTTQQKLSSIQLLETGMKAQEEERNRIATELHDGLSAHLASARMLLSVLKNQIHHEHHELIKNIQEIVDHATSTVQEIIRNITPQVLHNFGLVRAIDSYARKYKDAGIVIDIKNNLLNRLDEFIEIHLYRILQELLNNSIRHGKCKTIQITFTEHKHELIISFEHDGQSFNFEKALKLSSGFGLKNIMHRIQLLEGKFENYQSPAGGMIYKIFIPQKSQKQMH